jgi:vanillate O-demethylase ferredoxin subunit
VDIAIARTEGAVGHDEGGLLEVEVAAKWSEAEGICGLELRSPHGSTLPAFTPGAHVDVHLPNGSVRQYSLSNSHQERHRYRLAVLRDAKSRGGSVCVHDEVKAGDRILISHPRNHFPLDSDAPAVLIAGGIGITPLLCMAQALSAEGRGFTLHYCCRTRAKAAFAREIEASPFADKVRFRFDDEDGPLDARLVLQQRPEGAHLYVCGPGGFLDHVLSAAKAAGMPEEAVHREYFAAPPASGEAVDANDDRPFDLILARSGRRVTVAAGEKAIDALARCGVDVPVSCEQGVCGTCLTPVLNGVPEHRDYFLTEAERQKNAAFTPCCSRAKSDTLTIDL